MGSVALPLDERYAVSQIACRVSNQHCAYLFLTPTKLGPDDDCQHARSNDSSLRLVPAGSWMLFELYGASVLQV